MNVGPKSGPKTEQILSQYQSVSDQQFCCVICTHKPKGTQRPRASVDISGNARVPVLQLICDTSGMAAVFIC